MFGLPGRLRLWCVGRMRLAGRDGLRRAGRFVLIVLVHWIGPAILVVLVHGIGLRVSHLVLAGVRGRRERMTFRLRSAGCVVGWRAAGVICSRCRRARFLRRNRRRIIFGSRFRGYDVVSAKFSGAGGGCDGVRGDNVTPDCRAAAMSPLHFPAALAPSISAPTKSE